MSSDTSIGSLASSRMFTSSPIMYQPSADVDVIFVIIAGIVSIFTAPPWGPSVVFLVQMVPFPARSWTTAVITISLPLEKFPNSSTPLSGLTVVFLTPILFTASLPNWFGSIVDNTPRVSSNPLILVNSWTVPPSRDSSSGKSIVTVILSVSIFQ